MAKKNYSKEITWAPIFPLIGGFPLGAEKTIGTPPKTILKYDVAEYNDSLYIRHMNEHRKLDIPVHTVNEEGFDYRTIKPLEVDIAVATPFCSGLSMLNSSVGKGDSSRGSDAQQNKWIYESTEFVLKYNKPKVLIGENAPGLFTNIGDGVREKLYEIGNKYGYSISFIKTNTILHGLPQKRERTFYFLWKSERAPYINYIERAKPTISEYLSQCKEFIKEDLTENIKRVKEDVLYRFLTEAKGYSHKDLLNHKFTTLANYLWDDLKVLDEYISWLKENGAILPSEKEKDTKITKFDKALRGAEHWKNKWADGKGIWDSTLIFVKPDTHINAMIGKSESLFVHPTEERTLCQREKAWLMGIPHEFKVEDINGAVIGQNVPVNTAADMVDYAVKFINGELEMSDSDFIMQNNISKSIIYKRKTTEEIKLF